MTGLTLRSPGWLRIASLLPLFSLALLSGCGESVGKLTPVEGKITVDNAPLNVGEVTYSPADGTSNSKITIKGKVENGTYKMTTNGKPGVPSGKYKVTVVTMGTGSEPPPDPSAGMGGKPVSMTPQGRKANIKYESVADTPLSVEVPGGNFDLKLTK